jgi:hypothetical protein
MVLLECPFCNEIVEVEPPDKLHTAFSFANPIPSSYHGDIVKKKHQCQNKECKKLIIVSWYAPLDYLSRI